MRTRTIVATLACISALQCMTVTIAFAQKTSVSQSFSIELRRTALRDSILTHISGAQISSKTFNIQKFGAKNDGKTDCRPAFAKAIKKASAMKGGKIVVPAGTYYIKGPVVLQSNVCLELQKGATLKFARFFVTLHRNLVYCTLFVRK